MTAIDKAFCWETQAIEPADYAVQKRDVEEKRHHYFCISKDCAFPIIPAHWHETGVAWYRSEPVTESHNHIVSCPQRLVSGAGASIAGGKPFDRDTTRRVIVPNVLDKLELENIVPWPTDNPPSRKQIAELAAKAKRFSISGDIEDVVNAYVRIRGERADYPLEVNGNPSNYNRAFPWVWNLKMPWAREEWGQHIVRSYCSVKNGTMREGLWFLDVIAPRSMPQISMTIRREAIASDPKKAFLPDFLDAAVRAKRVVQLFWHGPPPQNGKTHEILGAGRPMNSCFAIRDTPHRPT